MVRRQRGSRRGAAGLARAVVFLVAGGVLLATGSAVQTSFRPAWARTGATAPGGRAGARLGH